MLLSPEKKICLKNQFNLLIIKNTLISTSHMVKYKRRLKMISAFIISCFFVKKNKERKLYSDDCYASFDSAFNFDEEILPLSQIFSFRLELSLFICSSKKIPFLI